MLKFFDTQSGQSAANEQMQEIYRELKESGVADNKEALAQKLLEMSLEKDPSLDKKQAQKSIADIVRNPDLLLFVAGAATLFGNASYVSQYSDMASQSENSTDRALNIIHAAVFASFTLEKIVDIGKSGLATSANLTRRESLLKMSSFMKDNYPLMAGGWLTSNQVASGAAFTAQAAAKGSSKDSVTAVARAMATSASLGMTLYKYHTIKQKEEETGTKLIDDRVRRVIEPIDQLLGDKIDAMGGAFPYLAAGMLTGPHVSIFYNRLTDKEHPKVSWASLSTIVGYSSFVAYLASKNDQDTTIETAETEVEATTQRTLALRDSFTAIAQDLLNQPDNSDINSNMLQAMCEEHLSTGEFAAKQIARATLAKLPANTTAQEVVQTLADEYATSHIQAMREHLADHKQFDREAASILKAQLNDILSSGYAIHESALKEKSIETGPVALSRRGFLGLGG